MIILDHIKPSERLNNFDPDRPMTKQEKRLNRVHRLAVECESSARQLYRERNEMIGAIAAHQRSMADLTRGSGWG